MSEHELAGRWCEARRVLGCFYKSVCPEAIIGVSAPWRLRRSWRPSRFARRNSIGVGSSSSVVAGQFRYWRDVEKSAFMRRRSSTEQPGRDKLSQEGQLAGPVLFSLPVLSASPPKWLVYLLRDELIRVHSRQRRQVRDASGQPNLDRTHAALHRCLYGLRTNLRPLRRRHDRHGRWT